MATSTWVDPFLCPGYFTYYAKTWSETPNCPEFTFREALDKKKARTVPADRMTERLWQLLRGRDAQLSARRLRGKIDKPASFTRTGRGRPQ